MESDSGRRREPRPGTRGTEREFSFGGVAVRGGDVAVIVPRGTRVIGLPKGGANHGETGEQAAAREVREEAGIETEVLEKLGDVRYWYRRRGRQIFKIVTFYLCTFVAGDVADHDHEVDDARWMPLAEARTALTYPGEREMIERALTALERNG